MRVILIIVIVFVSAFSSTSAAVSQLINYQGFLTDNLGDPINGTHSITLRVWNDASAGDLRFTETHPSVAVDNGRFTIFWGENTPLTATLFSTDSLLWLGISVDADPEITPRTAIMTVPFSFVTSRVDGDIKTEPNKITVAKTSNDTLVEITSGGIYMPKSTLSSTDDKVVVERELEVKSGEIILFGKYAGTEISIDGGDFTIIDENNLMPYLEIDSSGIKMANPASPDPQVEFNADGSFVLWNPGKTDTVLSFTPGSVTFGGTPVDFDGTEASWIASSTDTAVRIDTTGITLPSTGGGSIRITSDSLNILGGSGTIRANDGTLKIEPAGGGAGGRMILTPEVVRLTDDTGTDSISFHRTDGMVLVLGSSGTSAVYSGGIQLTGAAAKQFAANPTSISTKRPSTNTAWTYDLDDANDLFKCDLDDDAIQDIIFQHTPSKALRCESGTGFVCIGPATLTSLEVVDFTIHHGITTFESSVSGKSSFTYDPNDDATDDVSITASPTPTLSTAVGTDLDILGPAFFSSPVLVTSDLTVNGSFMATGAKFFVQQHPYDESKEIFYVALEGNEAGTYTCGSGQLDNGVAEIALPEDFALVTNTKGLTAQITPRGPVQSMLYVDVISPTKLIVKASNKKDADVKFDFMINGVRLGYENHKVIREKKYVDNN